MICKSYASAGSFFIRTPGKRLLLHEEVIRSSYLCSSAMTADALKKGETARITGLADHPAAAKLAEMGCLPGATIEKVLTAPLGDPAAFQIAGSFVLALRRVEAALVEVELTSDKAWE